MEGVGKCVSHFCASSRSRTKPLIYFRQGTDWLSQRLESEAKKFRSKTERPSDNCRVALGNTKL